MPDCVIAGEAYVMPMVRMGVLPVSKLFAPDQSVTGSEFAGMLSRAFGSSAAESTFERPDNQPLPLASALTWLQDVLAPPQPQPGVDARNRNILVRSLERATGRKASDINRPLTRAEAAVLLKAALGADNREPAAK